MSKERSPTAKSVMAGLATAILIVPLMMVYMLVWDRESQSVQAQRQITAGWGGEQTITGPMLVVPYDDEVVETETVDGATRERRRQVRRELFVSPAEQKVTTEIDPDRKGYAIYESVVYEGSVSGEARFVLGDDLERLGVASDDLRLGEAELR
ncbi:MAG: inner membrane CreD family protein, partial [Alteraurantiacibacter sp.]